MDEDDIVIEAFGVLLTQLRTARRALENIDRNTSSYTGFEFAKVLSQGAEFAQPPLYQGALMVHVVNIEDLAPGNGFGGFLEALLGGVGNFVSNLAGGLVGSFFTSFRLPKMLEHLDSIVGNVREILTTLGVGASRGHGEADAASDTGPSESLLTTLEGIRGTVRDVTALFQAASSGPDAAAETSQTPMTRTGERWMAILDGVNRLLDRATHLVDGLVLLIPNLVGGLAFFIANLGTVRNAILETLQFILRNAIVLRGVVLTVIFETISTSARLAAEVVGIVATTIQGILTTVVGVVRELLGTAFDALRLLADGLRVMADEVLRWLVEGVVQALRTIGDLPIFRTIDHLVRILPSLLGPVYMVMTKGSELPPTLQSQLDTAHAAGFAQGTTAAGTLPGTGTPATPGTETPGTRAAPGGTVPGFPDLAEIIGPLESTLDSAVDATASSLTSEVLRTTDEAGAALVTMQERFRQAAVDEANRSRTVLDTHVQEITANADALTTAITRPVEAQGPATGMEEIADAYESWLTSGGGLASLVDQIHGHFADRPAAGEPGGPLGLQRGQFDRPRASIEIDEVEIVIGTAAAPAEPVLGETPGPTAGLDLHRMTDEDVYRAWLRRRAELEVRGVRTSDLASALA